MPLSTYYLEYSRHFGQLRSVVVMRTRPRAIPPAMITMRKSTHGFPIFSYMSMGLRLATLLFSLVYHSFLFIFFFLALIPTSFKSLISRSLSFSVYNSVEEMRQALGKGDIEGNVLDC